jgi:Uma2 family endonuclease
MTVTTAKWTIHEYHAMIAAGLLETRQVELLRGEIIEMSPEGEPHAYSSSTAGEYLMRMLGERAMVRHAKPITLPNQSEPEPDIAVVQRLGREYLTHHPYPENIFWLIEYSESTLEKDLQVKSRIYAEVGIPEYWVVDLKKRQLAIFRDPQVGEYKSVFTQSEGTLCSLAFPEIVLSIGVLISA